MKSLAKWGALSSAAATTLDPGSTHDLNCEVARARRKFPSNSHMLAALVEEVGEVAKALLDGEGRDRVRAEALHVACVAMRMYEEGDADYQGECK